jgi:hypothetical protein
VVNDEVERAVAQVAGILSGSHHETGDA